jgi:hypothetical protein
MPEPLSIRSDGIFRLVLSEHAAADLVLRRDNTHVHFEGLFLRAFHDTIPICPFPDAFFDIATIYASIVHKRSLFSLEGKRTFEIDVTSVVLKGSHGSKVILDIPHLTHHFPPYYISFSFDRDPAGELTVFEVGRSAPSGANMPAKSAYTDTVQFGEGLLSADAAIFCISDHHDFLVVPHLLDPQAGTLTLKWDDESQRTRVISRGSDLASGRFVVFCHPATSQRRLGGNPTASFLRAGLILAFFEPLMPRFICWLVCCVASGKSFPQAIPPIFRQVQEVPHIVIGLDDGNWLASTDITSLGERSNVVVYFGHFPITQFVNLVREGRYEAVFVASESTEHLRECLCPFIEVPSEVQRGRLLRGHYGDRIVGGIVTDLTPDGVEESLFQIVLQTLVPKNATEVWLHHINHRLPRIPFVADLSVAPACLLANMLRGRIPSDTGSSDPDWSPLLRDDLWLVPWEHDAEPTTRSELIYEISRRIISEYMAIRAYGELVDKSFGRDEATHEPNNLQQTAAVNIRQWMRWAEFSVPEKAAQRQQLSDYMRSQSIGARDMITAFAGEIYNLNRNERLLLGATLVNPLVLVYATSADHPFSLQLDLSIGFWAEYAGKFSGSKPGAIVTTLLPETDVAEVRKLQSELRRAFHFVLDDNAKLGLKFARQALGVFMAKTLEIAGLDLLYRAGADRIVAFSDITLDFVPFEDTILGLEVPLSRLPASVPAYQTVNSTIEAACVPSRLSSDRRAILLVAPSAKDQQTKWAREIAESTASRLAWIGLSPVFVIEDQEQSREVLAKAQDAPVVFFFGHALASEHWAGLECGNLTITADDIRSVRWLGSFVILIGCETAAFDTTNGDLAWQFIARGARAVVGTTTKVSVQIADFFVRVLLEDALDGMPIDYAFFEARRRTAAFETLLNKMSPEEARRRTETVTAADRGYRRFSDYLKALELDWHDVEQHAIHALSFSLVGGAGERIV